VEVDHFARLLNRDFATFAAARGIEKRTSSRCGLGHFSMADRNTKGELYEYMPGKIATAGQNGKFRTPRNIVSKVPVDDGTLTPQCHRYRCFEPRLALGYARPVF
jgi:hypothetical protein